MALRVRGVPESAWEADVRPLRIREIVVATDTGRIKVGDGVHRWSDLPYSDETALNAVRDAIGQGEAGPQGPVGPVGPQGPPGGFTYGTPTATTSGVQGDVWFDANYLYVCRGGGEWSRVRLTPWRPV